MQIRQKKIIGLSKGLSLVFLVVFLVLLFGARYWLASTNKPLNDDETTGLFSVFFSSYWTLLKDGVWGASTSPLFYLFDKILYDILGPDLQRRWDLRFVFRFLHATYWALASTYVFNWVFYRVQKWFQTNFFTALALGLGFAFFYHSNSFLHIYAIEARGYSIWVSLSTIHFLAGIDLMEDDSASRNWWVFGVSSVLMCLATYTAYSQVVLVSLILICSRFSIIKELKLPLQSNVLSLLSKTSCVLFVSGAVSVYYLSKAVNMPYDVTVYFTLERYFDSITEVLAKCFHHSSAVGLFFSIPFLFLFLGWNYRKNPKFNWLLLHCLGMIALTVVYFFGSKWKGGLWAPRYVINLIPTFSALYFFGLFAISIYFSKLVGRYFSRPVSPLFLLVIWSLLEIFTRSISYQKMIVADLPRWKERKSFGNTNNSLCPPFLGPSNHMAVEVEKMNDRCRGLMENEGLENEQG